MQKERTFKEKLTLFLKGLVMGVANKVPGVSGGTVSFVFGFYEELIYSFRKIKLRTRINLKTFNFQITIYEKNFFNFTFYSSI
jgi:uncharacterized membrane protein